MCRQCADTVATPIAVGVTVLAGLGVFLASTSADAHERGMVFRDNRPRNLTLKEAETGVTVSVCNTESRAATALDARFDGFGFKSRTGNDVDTTAVFEKLAVPESLAEGSCAELTITKKPNVRLADGSYAGLATVSSGGAGLARLELTLTVAPKRKAITPTGALDDAPLRANRDGPLEDPLGLGWPTGGTELEDGGYLPLKAPRRGSENLALPRRGSALGSIFNGSDRARVFVGSGRVVEYDDVWLMPLSVESADKVGDYKGELDLAQSNTTDSSVCGAVLLTLPGVVRVPASPPRVGWRPSRPIAAPTPEDRGAILPWWAGRPDKFLWMEITDRSDIGADLHCPQRDSADRANPGYSTILFVADGDIVAHYDRNRQAITSWSIARGSVETAPTKWVSHRGAVRRRLGTDPRGNPVGGWISKGPSLSLR
jgi:hypothetical protein